MTVECHGITIRTSGKAEMAYAGDRPWHGLGDKLDADATMETWLKAAGMDFSIQESDIMFSIPTGPGQWDFEEFASKKVLYRSDNRMPLSVVGDKYKVVQPEEVLYFFKDMVEEQGFKMHTAGTLFGGKKFWALAKMSEERFVGKNQDAVGGFVLLSTSTDGSLSTTAKFTSIAVVCNNTLGWANKQNKGDAVRTMHTKTFDADSVKSQLGLAHEQYDQLMGAAETLSKVQMNMEEADQFIKFLYENSRLSTGKSVVEESKPYQSIMSLFNGAAMGADLPTREGTAWGLLNSVTEYVDHHSGGKTADRRINQAWFGAGNTIKQDALSYLLERAA